MTLSCFNGCDHSIEDCLCGCEACQDQDSGIYSDENYVQETCNLTHSTDLNELQCSCWNGADRAGDCCSFCDKQSAEDK